MATFSVARVYNLNTPLFSMKSLRKEATIIAWEMNRTMPEEKVEFKWLEVKLIGSDTVVFRLEDGTMIKVRVNINRAGVSTNLKNPDGSPYYHADTGLQIQIVPRTKKFYIPKSRIKKRPPKERKFKPI